MDLLASLWTFAFVSVNCFVYKNFLSFAFILLQRGFILLSAFSVFTLTSLRYINLYYTSYKTSYFSPLRRSRSAPDKTDQLPSKFTSHSSGRGI